MQPEKSERPQSERDTQPDAGQAQPRLAKKRLLACGAALLALAFALALGLPLLHRHAMPLRYVLKAFERTARRVERDWQDTARELGLFSPGENPTQRRLYVEERDSGHALGLDVTLRSDPAAGLAAAFIDVETARVPVFTMNVTAEGDVLAVEAPSVLAGRYGVSTQGLGAQWNNAPLSQMAGFELEEDLSFSLESWLRQGLLAGEGRAAASAFEAAQPYLVAQRTGRAETEVNGTLQSCEGYTLTLSGQALAAFLQEMEQAVLTGSLLQAALAAQAVAAGLAAQGPGQETSSAQMVATLRQFFEELRGHTQKDGLAMEVYIKDGYVVKALLQAAGAEEKDAAPRLELELGDGKRLAGALALRGSFAGGWFGLAFTGGRTPKADGLNARLALEYGSEPEVTAGGLELTLGLEDAGPERPLRLEAVFWGARGTVRLDTSGTLQTQGKSAATTLLLEEITALAGGRSYRYYAEYTAGPLAGQLAPEAAPVMLLELDRQQLEALYRRMNLAWLARLGLNLQA